MYVWWFIRLLLTEHEFLPSSQDCFKDIFIGKGGRTKGEYKYACVDVELKCLCAVFLLFHFPSVFT